MIGTSDRHDQPAAPSRGLGFDLDVLAGLRDRRIGSPQELSPQNCWKP